MGSVAEIIRDRCRFSISLCYKLRYTERRLNDALSTVDMRERREMGRLRARRSIMRDKSLECSRTKPPKRRKKNAKDVGGRLEPAVWCLENEGGGG